MEFLPYQANNNHANLSDFCLFLLYKAVTTSNQWEIYYTFRIHTRALPPFTMRTSNDDNELISCSENE